MAASKKREKEGYDNQGLDSRQEVEQALAGAQYRPSQKRDKVASSCSRCKASGLRSMKRLSGAHGPAVGEADGGGESFRIIYDSTVHQQAQAYTQNAQNASADCAVAQQQR